MSFSGFSFIFLLEMERFHAALISSLASLMLLGLAQEIFQSDFQVAFEPENIRPFSTRPTPVIGSDASIPTPPLF